MDYLEAARKRAKDVIESPQYTHEQKQNFLAGVAADLFPIAQGKSTERFLELADNGLMSNMGESHAVYVPRYILPDYAKFLSEGSEFLRLPAPKTLYEAIYSLLCFYHHTPSVTNFPVWLGNWGDMLEPFCEGMTDEEISTLMRGFLIQLDRTFGDSFVHVNIGPAHTRIAGITLDLIAELQDAIPNMSLIYDPEITPDDFALHAIKTALECANPAFAYDPAYKKDFGEHAYGISSCYNGLPVGGGAFTLHRMNLGNVAKAAKDEKDFFENVLPEAVTVMCDQMEAHISFLVKESGFFKGNWLVNEGFISLDKFIGLFGMVGLADAVDTLMQYNGKDLKFGPDKEANELGVHIMDFIDDMVKHYDTEFSAAFDHHFRLHAQVGVGEPGVTPGARIPIGRELPLYDHLRQAGLYHKYFPTGVGDIFPFDTTAKRNPAALLDIFKGAFKVGMRYLSTYSADGDLIRVTGYLVKKSELEAAHNGDSVINNVSLYNYDKLQKDRILERKVRSLD